MLGKWGKVKSQLFGIQITAIWVVNRPGFEPGTHSLEGCCSIQLSYQSPFVIAFHRKRRVAFPGNCRCKVNEDFLI